MAKANRLLVEKLREAARNLETGKRYNWGHVSHCNCGHLAQCLTPWTPEAIYQRAEASLLTEWSEYANDYCPANGAPIDEVMDVMFEAGLERNDIRELEYLSNPQVLEALPGGPRTLRRGNRQDAAIYMRTWAALLELELPAKVAAREPSLVGA